MLKIESREAANLKSRVKDLSQVPNLVNYAGLFACITPIAKTQPVNEVYKPILIRDTESLIANFGDPRIDPEKYVDLYSIMQLVGNGSSCYVAKVSSGNTGIYPIILCKGQLYPTNWEMIGTDTLLNKVFSYNSKFNCALKISKVQSRPKAGGAPTIINPARGNTPATGEYIATWTETSGTYSLQIQLGDVLDPSLNLLEVIIDQSGSGYKAYQLDAYSSLTDPVTISASVSQAKPFSLGTYYLNMNVVLDGNTLATAKVLLTDTLTNKGLVDSLTTPLSPYIQFELSDKNHAGACSINDDKEYSIVRTLLDLYAPIIDGARKNISSTINIDGAQIVETNPEITPHANAPTFEVTLDNYKNALMQYKDKRYAGCLMADFVAPLTHRAISDEYSGGEDDAEIAAGNLKVTFGVPTPTERRSLHYYIKQIACERKDTNAILSVPLINNDKGNGNDYIGLDRYDYDGTDLISRDDICDWVSSQGLYTELWEYGQTNTTDYAEQSFYLEIYYTWLSMNCIKLENGIAKPVTVQVAPANAVVNNVLRSFRERGPHLPVAGDQYGTLPSIYSVIVNPQTKVDRDQLVQYRINPIYDTGTRGVQIYGNETLNAGYTDLNAAHIARSLVNLRSRIDEYTETLKFSLNNNVLWDTWKAYVSSNILEPAKSINAIRSYSVAMGYDTTTPEEIANRKVNGQVSLQFYQSAEIFDLTFTIFSTSAEELG